MNYAIKNSSLTVEIKTLSGTFASVKDSTGREYLWQGDPAFWTGQAPVCFPVCGGLRDFKAVTESGKAVSMKRHGIVKNREFTLEEQGPDHISMALESDEELLKQYPFPFRLENRYSLNGKQITVTYSITNTGTEKMPFFIGGHPAWRCPLDPGEDYTDYQIDFEKDESETTPTPVNETGLIDEANRLPGMVQGKTLPLSHELFRKYEIIFDECLKSRELVYHHKKDPEKGLKVTFRDFPYLVLWSKRTDAPFIAIEPWAGLSTCSDEDDVLEHKRNVQIAAPGETKEYSFQIEVLG